MESQLPVKMLDSNKEELRLHKRGKVQNRGINGSQNTLKVFPETLGRLML